jgi:hypothetical protein
LWRSRGVNPTIRGRFGVGLVVHKNGKNGNSVEGRHRAWLSAYGIATW